MAFEVILVLDWYSVSRYIHANPVRDGLVPDAAHWPYSSYLEWIGERRGALIDRDFVRRFFPSPQSYRDLVADLSAERQLPEEPKAYLDA